MDCTDDFEKVDFSESDYWLYKKPVTLIGLNVINLR
jgi:hypothetical protein